MTSLGTLYRHIKELPLNKYVECENGNIAALVTSGYPDPAEILETWQRIRLQFADAIGNHEFIMFRNVFRDITVLSINLAGISMLIDVLRGVYNKDVADRLNKALGTKLVFNHLDPVGYQKMLDGCVMRSKSIKIKIDLLEMQQEAMKKKHTDGNVETWEYYQSMLITLSDHVKYELKDTITVFEFCTRVKRFNKHCADIEAQRQKHLKR